MERYDLAVVGGSFAGLAAAGAATSRGLSAAVFDRRLAPGHCPNTTGILVKELADEWDVPRSLTRKISGVRLYGPSLRSVDLTSPGYYFLATDIRGLLHWWAEEARRAGVTLKFRNAFAGSSLMNGEVGLRGLDCSARFLIGADGARSSVATDQGFGVNRRFLAGVEAEMEGVGGVDEDRLHVFLDSKIAPGYIAWVVPGVNGITQVGMAAVRKHRLDLNVLQDSLGRVFDFSKAKRVGLRAGLIPVGGAVRRFANERAMLIGDAAGWVSPLTAGGIHTAIHYGRLAGVAVTDYLADGGVEPGHAMRPHIPSYPVKQMMRWAWDYAPPNRVLDWAMGSRVFRAFAQTVFYHHRGLMTAEAWKDLAMCLRAA